MISGEVNDELEPIIALRIRGTEGTEIEIRSIVDTGFSDFLALPAPLVHELGLYREDATIIRLADGSIRAVDVVQGSVWWNDEWRRILIQVSEGDPLIGMALLKNHFLAIEVIERGEVTIEPRS